MIGFEILNKIKTKPDLLGQQKKNQRKAGKKAIRKEEIRAGWSTKNESFGLEKEGENELTKRNFFSD